MQALSTIDQFLACWVGFRVAPANQIMTRAQWRRDSPDRYCRRCGGTVGPGEATSSGCGACRESQGLVDGVVRLGAYEGALRDWILGLKYRGWHEMGVCLGAALGEALTEAVALSRQTVILPAPMPAARRLFRGLDHADIVARQLSRTLRHPILRVLRRSMGPTQVSLPAHQRRQAGGRGLHLTRRGKDLDLAGWDVLLVDDVRTTGSTLRAMGRLVRPLGARRVMAGILAVSDAPGRRASGPANVGP